MTVEKIKHELEGLVNILSNVNTEQQTLLQILVDTTVEGNKLNNVEEPSPVSLLDCISVEIARLRKLIYENRDNTVGFKNLILEPLPNETSEGVLRH